METAKIFTDGNAQINANDDIRLASKSKTKVEYLPDDVIMKLSDELIEENLEAYKELAK